MRKIRVPFFLLVAILIPLATLLTIKLAKGYSFNLAQKKFDARGILAVTSVPDGAQVFIDGQLQTATNNTIFLPPGQYEVEIKKEGFASWVKRLKIEKELVTQTQAFLFSAVPDLRPITFSGAFNPSLAPDGSKIAYAITATESGKSGIWVEDLAELPLGLSRGAKQITKSLTKNRDFSKAQIVWSPDSRQILVNLGKENFLLDTSQTILETNLQDISFNLENIQTSWQEDEKRILKAKFNRLPKQLQQILRESATGFDFSPDGEKLLYEATSSAQIPSNLIPPVPAASTQTEERQLQPEKIYIYDLKEDRNFIIVDSQNLSSKIFKPLTWFSTSRHLLWIEEGKISLIEYDGTNNTAVFTGTFENSFVFPAPGANKIILLTNFGQEENQTPNLYSLNLR